ncbi:hypothetical protein WJX72_011687 [[Myrmecia] bisecta]|uniref:Uncharacterized protein n=1 Tax=[Myrmecia] bisecta TaxID=41462 RepID=A0AAW1QTN0_9CHLO
MTAESILEHVILYKAEGIAAASGNLPRQQGAGASIGAVPTSQRPLALPRQMPPGVRQACWPCYAQEPTSNSKVVPAGERACVTCGAPMCEDCATFQLRHNPKCTLCDYNHTLFHSMLTERFKFCEPEVPELWENFQDPEYGANMQYLVCSSARCAKQDMCFLEVFKTDRDALLTSCTHSAAVHPKMALTYACEDPAKRDDNLLEVSCRDVVLIAGGGATSCELIDAMLEGETKAATIARRSLRAATASSRASERGGKRKASTEARRSSRSAGPSPQASERGGNTAEG